MKTSTVCVITLLLLSKLSFSQLNLDTTSTAEQLASSIVEPGLHVSNIKLNCPSKAFATFSGTSDMGIEKGILLTTGIATNANGPNNSANASYDNKAPGDSQLESIAGTSTFDGCALEFDFIPASDSLKISYVFGSEEYPEYIGKPFNDLFGLFISGPGITGTKNLGNDPLENTQDLINNANGLILQYDGFTKPITAVQALSPCGTYHLKIVIADVQDGIYDSGLFIKAGSLKSSPEGKNTERCGSGNVVLYASAAGSGTLNWYSQPTGGNIVGTGSNLAMNLSDTRTFYVENTYTSCSSVRTPITATINPQPSKPTITENNGILSAPAGYTYQWNLEGTPLPGEIHQTHTPTKKGSYTVLITTEKNCTAISDPYIFTVGIKSEQLDALVNIYPNPAYEIIYIQAPVNGSNLIVSIYSVIGNLIYQEAYSGSNPVHSINIGKLDGDGMYFVKLQSDNETITRKISIHQ